MNEKRVERTLFHRNIGLFRYSAELSNCGVEGPYDQVAAIGKIIEDYIGKSEDLPFSADEQRVEGWLRNVVRSVADWVKAPDRQHERLEYVALRASSFVAWDIYTDFAELLNLLCGPRAYEITAGKLRRHGVLLSLEALTDMTTGFVSTRLPRAVRSFRPERGAGRETEWLATVFYRYALNQSISDRINRNTLELFNDVEGPRIIKQSDESREAALESLPEALAELPDWERLAVELYFGFRGREYTLAEVAQELATSEYLARTSIVRSLGKLCLSLGMHGELNEQESNLLRLMFNEGYELKPAAVRVGMEPHKARGVIASVNEKFRRSLRVRTNHPLETPPRERVEREAVMGNDKFVTTDQIVRELRQIGARPDLRPSGTGSLLVRVDDSWTRVERVREIVIRQPDLLKSLRERGVELDWLAAPVPSTERPDLPPDHAEWVEELQSEDQRNWVLAESLYRMCLNEAERRRVAFVAEKQDETVERIHRTLGGISQAVESTLPDDLYVSDNVYFRLDRVEGDRVRGRWEDDPSGQTIDIQEVTENNAGLFGELPAGASEILSEVFVHSLFEGDAFIPGFRRLESTAETVWLEFTLFAADSSRSTEAQGASARTQSG